MNPYFRFLFLYFTISFVTLLSSAQDLPVVQKSTVIEQSSGVDYYIHTVEAGHTLYSIARVYAISIADLKAINPGLNPDLIPGQVIKIPLAPEIATELVTDDPVDFDTVQFFRYHVLPGETLYHLSKVYNAEIAEIQRINDGLPGGLKAGTTILLP
ncbi:MAG: LysM peptidoglycan-binding domain-containing protein, partial [Bacteroidia bacterium]|nr:LysM peptidoglycan-binding domain-containing protein [Bacteroidia bacterium]